MKETISFRIAKENREKLDLIATSLHTDRSALIDEAIRAYLEFNTWFIEEVERGIKDADEGDFASTEEVEAVFNRLSL